MDRVQQLQSAKVTKREKEERPQMKQTLKLICVPLAAAILAAGLTLQAAIVNAAPAVGKSEQTQKVTHPSKKQSSFKVVGILRYLPVEGGCYQIETDSGQTFEPLGNFPKQDGVRVEVHGQLVKDVATICQVGQPLQVKSIKIIG